MDLGEYFSNPCGWGSVCGGVLGYEGVASPKRTLRVQYKCLDSTNALGMFHVEHLKVWCYTLAVSGESSSSSFSRRISHGPLPASFLAGSEPD